LSPGSSGAPAESLLRKKVTKDVLRMLEAKMKSRAHPSWLEIHKENHRKKNWRTCFGSSQRPMAARVRFQELRPKRDGKWAAYKQ